MEDHIGYTLALLVGEDIKQDNMREEEIIAEIQEEDNTGDDTEVDKMKNVKEEPMDMKMDSSRLQCHVCYKVMGHRSSLYKHLKYIHKIEPAHRLPITCREKDCMQSFTFIDPFRRHLAEHHGFNIVVEKYVFQNMAEFFTWKKMTEQEENLRFIVSTGPRSSKNGKTHYYRCQKNGTYKPEMKKRLQSDDPQSVYNVSRTHCISSMFVFEEAGCVTVEFCRTHYGHEVNPSSGLENKVLMEVDADSSVIDPESSLMYENIDSIAKLNSYLTKKDKMALANILSKNHQLLEDSDDLFYENEQDVMLKIPRDILKKVLKDEMKNAEKNEGDSEAVTTVEEDGNSEELTITKIERDEDEEEDDEDDDVVNDSKDSTILKSLGNGVFLDPTSNKRLKLDSLKNRSKKPTKSRETTSQQDSKKKDRNKNTMFLREYLNEFNEKVYILEPVNDEETVVQKREKILAQLQTILMIVNNEEDLSVLDEIKKDLSKYAIPY